MSRIKIPEDIKYILRTLEKAGYKAYAVGGCTRDSILGNEPDDWDCASSALPEEVMLLFENALPTGIKHGTVTIIVGSVKCEVTTFRSDGEYINHRRPEGVKFVKNIVDDLARRDFTMNAVALSVAGELIDPFGGIKDIEKGIIKCVGNAETRFEEDALRMFRALRFSSKLGFEIEENTLKAIFVKSALAAELASERVYSELCKLLLGKCAAPASIAFSCGLMDKYCPRTEHTDFSRLEDIESEISYRLSGLCVLLDCDSAEFLRKLKAPNSVISCVSKAVSATKSGMPTSRRAWKMLLRDIGEEAARCAVRASFVLNGVWLRDELEEIISSCECWSVAGLKIGGRDLAEIGFIGCGIGSGLDALLEHVIMFPDDNKRDCLIKLAEKLKKH